jgi:hypothetical protein
MKLLDRLITALGENSVWLVAGLAVIAMLVLAGAR